MRFLELLSVCLVLLAFVGAVPLESAPAKLDAKAKKVLPVLAKLQKKYQRLDAREKEKLLTKADGYRQKFKSVLSQIDDEVAQHYGLEINVIHEILGMSEPAALPNPAPAHDHPLHPAAPEELHQDPVHHHHEPAYPLHGHDHSNMVHVHNPEPVRHVEPVRHLEPEVQLEPEIQAGILERAAASLGLGGHQESGAYEDSMVDSGKGAQQSVDKQEILEHDQKSVVDEEYMRVLDNFVDQQINGDSYQHKSHLEGLEIHKDSDDLVWNLEEFEKLPVYYTNKNQESGDTIREMADNYFKPILPFSSYLKKQVDEAWFGGIAYPWYPRAQRVRVDAPYVANYYDPYDPYDQAFRPRKPTLRASWRPSLTRNPIGFDYDKPIRSFARTNKYYSRPITSLADQYAYQRIGSRYIEHPMRSRYVSRGFKGILPSYRKEWDY